MEQISEGSGGREEIRSNGEVYGRPVQMEMVREAETGETVVLDTLYRAGWRVLLGNKMMMVEIWSVRKGEKTESGE